MCGIIIVRVDQPISFAWIWISNIGQLFMCVLFQFSLFYRLEGTWLWDYFDKTFTHVQVNTGHSRICTNLHANKIKARDIMLIIVFTFSVLKTESSIFFDLLWFMSLSYSIDTQVQNSFWTFNFFFMHY